MAKQKKFSPYCMRTIKRTKVNGVRIYLKAYRTKPQDLCGQPVSERIFFYQITSSDGGVSRLQTKTMRCLNMSK